MSSTTDDKGDQKPSLKELLTPGPESSDPDYLAWKKAKIERALEQAKAHPEERITQKEIWKKFGLE